jgi:hypothetical protein
VVSADLLAVTRTGSSRWGITLLLLGRSGLSRLQTLEITTKTDTCSTCHDMLLKSSVEKNTESGTRTHKIVKIVRF